MSAHAAVATEEPVVIEVEKGISGRAKGMYDALPETDKSAIRFGAFFALGFIAVKIVLSLVLIGLDLGWTLLVGAIAD